LRVVHTIHTPDYDDDDGFFSSLLSPIKLLKENRMEMSVDRDAFLRGLQMVSNLVEARQTLPILSNILLDGEGETLRLTATDLEVGARVSLPAKVAKGGSITLSARKLLEIAKELPSAPLSLRSQENAWVSVRCGGVAYRLVGLPPEDYPAVTGAETANWLTLNAKLLREMIAQTSFAVSHDESRYALNGVLFVLQAKEIRLVATDGHRLALAIRPLPTGGPTASGIVPRKAVHEIERVLGGAGEEASIAINQNQFILQMPNFLMLARLIEGTFPNYEQVVPRSHPHRVTIPRAALSSALRRVSILAEERTRPVKLALAPGMLRLTAFHQEYGEAEEGVEVEYAGEEVVIGFNSRYLLDALGALESEQVVLEVKDAASPGIIRSFEDEGSLCVIMPMRI
jgi:DNA polymerase-3 subunit beta